MRILALDWGEKRIGAAISDELGIIASPFDKAFDGKNAVNEIKKVIAEHGVGGIILGWPKTLQGKDSFLSGEVAKLKTNLSKLGVEIILLDERFTTVAAKKLLQQQEIKEKDQKGLRDNIAAQTMLQQYLDTKAIKT